MPENRHTVQQQTSSPSPGSPDSPSGITGRARHRGAGFLQRPWLHALTGAAAGFAAIGTGNVLGELVVGGLSLTGFAARLVPAALVTVFALALLLTMTASWAQVPLARIGLIGWRSSAQGFLLGVLVVTLSAALVFGTGTALGWVAWDGLDAGRFVSFLLANGVIALLLEALPEELALRGYTFSALRSRYGSDVAVFLTTGLFIAGALALGFVTSLPQAVAGGDLGDISLVPEGDTLLNYVSFILVLGLLLGYARLATSSGTIWTCIGAHLTVLTVNRATVFGGQSSTGVSLTLNGDLAFLLLPAYLTVAIIVFAFLQKPAGRQTAPA